MKTKEKITKISKVVVICIFISTLAIFIPTNNIASATTQEEKLYCTATLEDDFADNQIMVVITNNVSISNKRYTIQDFADINCVAIEDLFEASENNSKFNSSTYHRILALTIGNPGKQNVLNAIKILEDRDDVLCADPNYTMEIFSVIETQSNPSLPGEGSWWKDTIDLAQAKTIESGSANIKVGIIDVGVDCDHPALVDNIDTNLAKAFPESLNRNPLIDEHGHGTYIAGIIGAKQVHSPNGVEGICDSVTIVPLRIVLNDEYSYQAALAEADELNLPIVNFSIGGEMADEDRRNVVLFACMNYDGLIICAAGNAGTDNDETHTYPACFELPNILSVGNSTHADGQNNQSNYGRRCVDIFAPGTNIHTTDNNGFYTLVSGTSIAAPMVTGVAALLLSRCPTMTIDRLRFTLLSTAETVLNSGGESVFEDLCVSGGRLNAYDALVNHEHSYASLGATKGHSISCSMCNHTAVEGHTWLEELGFFKCIYCRVRSNHIEILHPITEYIGGIEYGRIGDIYFKMSDFVLINGKYYLSIEHALSRTDIDIGHEIM